MAKLVAGLAIVAAGFAASTAYLAWELHETGKQADERNRNADANGAAANEASRQSQIVADKQPEPAPVRDASPAKPDSPADKNGDPAREAELKNAKKWLAQYDDPVQRALMERKMRSGLDPMFGRFRARQKLTDDVYDQLMAKMVDGFNESQAHYYRCLIDSACEGDAAPVMSDNSEEIRAVLGERDYEAFKKFRDTTIERQAVAQLRTRLDDANFLRDADAERFVAALSDESARIQDEVQASGADLGAFGTGDGMAWYIRGGTPEQQLASAREYSQRIRERVAGVLNIEQMRVFVQMQQQLLEDLATTLHDPPK